MVKYYWIAFVIAAFLGAIAANSNNESKDDFNSRDFYSVPTTVKTFENDTVLLPCDYKYAYGSVRWLKDDILLMDAPHSEQVFFERYHLLNNGSLVVLDVQAEDTGRYYCEIVTTDTVTAVQSHAIEVQYPPRVWTTPSGFIELPIGAVLEIICETEGVPQPAITWTHNNKSIIDYLVGNRQSHIVDIKSRSMSGSIECIARNGVGVTASDGVELTVLFPPVIHTPQKIYFSKSGGRVEIVCTVESAPLAKIRWFHDGKPIILGPLFNRYDNELNINQTQAYQRYFFNMQHSLVIKNTRESDMGMYECRAENTIGVQSGYIELTFRPMPCTFKMSPDMQSPTSHVLVWQTESYSPIIEFKLKFRQMPSENSMSYTTTTLTSRPEWTELIIPSDISIGPIHTTTYTLNGLHPASIYQVVVVGRNHFGWSDSSKILRFATGGEVEFPNYSTESDMDNDQLNNYENDKTPDDIERHNQKPAVTNYEMTENAIELEDGRKKTLYSSMYAFSAPSSSSSSLSPSILRSVLKRGSMFNWIMTVEAFVMIFICSAYF